MYQWHHFAFCRSGGTGYLYVDGTMQESKSLTVSATSDTVYIGRAAHDAGAYRWTGYVQDFRIYNGVAKYTSNFEPATTYPAIIPDSPSGVVHSSALAKYTNGSVSFDGTGDYLELASSSDLEMGTGDFTVEMWVYSLDSSTNTQDRRFFCTEDNAASSIQVGHIETTSGNVEYADQGNANIRVTGTTNILNTWAHVAVVRKSGTVSLYVNGKSEGTPATDNNSKTADNPTIGKYPGASGHFKGHMSNLRVIKGTALYTANFTPCLLYTSPSPRDRQKSRMPSSA